MYLYSDRRHVNDVDLNMIQLNRLTKIINDNKNVFFVNEL